MKAWQNKALIWETAGLSSILIVGILLIYNRCLYGLDFVGISLLDGGYRVFSGQLPFRDFHTPVGHALFYWQAAFYHIFGGFSFKVAALQAALMSAVGTLLVFLILRLYIGSIASLFFAGIAVLTFSMPRGIPSWDAPANMFYLVALAAFSFAYKYRDKLNLVKIIFWAVLSGLTFVASIFTKLNIGLAAVIFTVPLWLLISFGKKDKLINRVKSFGICLLFTLSFILLFFIYITSQGGDIIADLSHIGGQSNRLLVLLPHVILKRLLSKDFGKIFLIVYISVVTLPVGFKYLLKLNIKDFLKDQGLIATLISLTFLSYLVEMSSRSAGLTAFGLFALLLGLLYAILSRLKDSFNYVKVEHRRLSNFCLITGLVASVIFLLWGLTYQNDFPGRTIQADRFFLAAMLVIAVVLFTLGFFYRKPKRIPFSSIKNIFIGGRIYIVFLALSLILYFVYDVHLGRRAMARMLMPLLKKTDIVELVEFKDIPALNGVYANRKMIMSIEGFVSWIRPKLDAEPSLRDGSGIYIFPYGQSLYGILGVESFRNVRLFLLYTFTFSQPDPDTDEILKRKPRFIVRYNPDKFLHETSGPGIPIPRLIPRLEEVLLEDYFLAAQFDDIFVFQRIADRHLVE